MPPLRRIPSEFPDETYPGQTRGMGLLKIAWSWLQPFLTDAPVWQTDVETGFIRSTKNNQPNKNILHPSLSHLITHSWSYLVNNAGSYLNKSVEWSQTETLTVADGRANLIEMLELNGDGFDWDRGRYDAAVGGE